MLVSLSIRDIVLIEELDIEFSSGFSVLTGETGAGKSILLGAFSFVLGGKGNASLVRQGKQQGEVIAVFKESQNHPVHSLLEKNSFKSEVKIILKRVQLLDGRTRSFINDKPVGLGLVRLIGSSLAEIHGQHDDRAFVDSLTHRDLLDSFGGYAGAYENCRVSWKNWRESKEQLRLHRIEMEAAMREEDYFRSSLDELEKLDSKPGEEEALATLRLNMMNAEKIVSDIKDLYENLTGDYSPSQKILSSLRPLQRRTGSLPSAVEEIVHILEQALLALDSACVRVESTLNEIAYDSVQLEKTEERLFALRAAGRKYNKSPDTLNELRDKLIHDLRKIDNGQELLKQLEKKEIAMSHIYEECSARLSFLRHQAAQDLCSSVLSELPALKLESSDFLVDVVSDSSQPSESGIDRVEFKIRTSPTKIMAQ